MSGTPHDRTRLIDEMASLLRASRRKVCWSFITSEASRGLTWGAAALVVLAVIYLFLRMVGMLTALPALPGLGVMVLLCLAVMLLALSASLARAMAHLPSVLAAAERLDLTAQSHNRVATALWLATTDADTPFDRAAIEDGLAHLRRIADASPQPVAASAGSWRAIGLQVVAAVGVLILAATLPGYHARTGHHHGPPLAEGPAAPALAPTTAPHRKHDEATSKPATPTPTPEADTTRANRQAVGAKPTDPIQSEAASGRAGGGVTAQAQTAGTRAGTQGGSSKASSPSEVDGKRKPPGKKRASADARIAKQDDSQTEQGASASGQGQSGGGSMLAVQSNWSQRAGMTESDADEDDADEDIEEEREGNRQRGGVQPSLKDRNEAPGRELGISEGQGPPGSGRGGPTPPKKARGVASLVLGVPIPDFVKGRLAPGTTKVTHELVHPSAMPGEPAKPAEPKPRSMPEDVVSRYETPYPLADVIRNYLIALHAADRQPAGADADDRLPQPTEDNEERGSLP